MGVPTLLKKSLCLWLRNLSPGRRNARATYQRMMDKIFREQIGRNVEVYADDILIKSLLAVNLIKDVEETCRTLRQYGLKLNPLKCLFGAKGGKFLASPDLKETQKLVGRITALSRFISRSADRAAPFFKVLRKTSKFQWDEGCTRAFEELKKYLEALPSLFKSVVGEPLWVYLSATPEVVGAVLVKEHDNVQRPVYFFSHLLKGVEARYTTLEKLVYGLVLMARRLRPYFLAHPITVLTNSTMGRALTNIEVVGRLIKWATELGEYDIQYQPRTAIKAQALADFLTEIHQTNSEETWKVYVDESTNHQGSGVGVLLISPQGDILQLVVRLNFRVTNNEAEYEALLAGLQATRHIGAARMKGEFAEITVAKIPRSENEKADELAKMASSLTTWVLDRSTAQTFLIAQIDMQNNREATIDWRTPMIDYLRQGILSTDPEESRLIRKQAHAYVMIGDQLYKRSFSRPLLKCLDMEEADQALREIHLGCCGNHVGGRTLSRKVLLAGYFWHTLQRDAHKLWGTGIVGPFPIVPSQRHFLLVAIDYFSKWVEAEALARITEDVVIQFLWKNILCRFGIPHKLVSDNGRQFQGQKIQAWCKGFDITQAFTSVAYPQSNGQTEVVNREIIRGLKVKLDHVGGNWVEELSSILWAYRTTPRESTGLTPFHLVYGNEAVVPIEIGVPSVRRTLYDEENSERWLAELDLISETRDRTAAQLEDDRGKKLDRPWSANYLRPYKV
ncbi:uncharacterized protein LOC122004494 [Zingiber officinale]|uniref:uncharacterized protein LOC122004494 n=1 Tax=Zingiber officinale TaxID=94328 RepID=UPI001C4C65B7|nr:uncharacterized protein LOC122004494 [Zingiber officinale]